MIRVSAADPSSCPPGCSYVVQTASIGSPNWTTVQLPGGDPVGETVQLSRGGSDAYLLVTQNPAGGASSATSTLYRSVDSGAKWFDGGEPCAQNGNGPNGEVDAVAVAAGNGAAVTVLCTPRGGLKQASFVTVSNKRGRELPRSQPPARQSGCCRPRRDGSRR